jgi:hypothetical protein
MDHTTDHDQHGYHRPNTLRVTVRQSESKTRKGYHDERTARKWLYVRLPPRVFHQAGLERGDVAEVTLYFPKAEANGAGIIREAGVINIRKEWDGQKVFDDE